ncbi:hypothetical protein AB0395_41135 [Streptosporangium sp. NPDC051023]
MIWGAVLWLLWRRRLIERLEEPELDDAAPADELRGLIDETN